MKLKVLSNEEEKEAQKRGVGGTQSVLQVTTRTNMSLWRLLHTLHLADLSS